MQLDQALTDVTVLGAAGKMGRGIALLLLQEMSRLAFENHAKQNSFTLNLIDVNKEAFPSLRIYLRDQLYKFAEKNINSLRRWFKNNPELISNEENITFYVNETLDRLFFDTSLELAKNSHLIFEAVFEDVDVKSHMFKTIAKANPQAFFLTNTSCIPIQVLNGHAHLNHRIIGFHFYNPPPVQKLLEIIAPPKTDPMLTQLALELAKRLNKIVIHSNDIAGFIGNGYLCREIAFAGKKTEELTKKYDLAEALYMINRVTQEWLIRPMGIFQLVDYVGLDVCQKISHLMSTYLKDSSLQVKIIDQMIDQGVVGGQRADGTQRDGFFSYEGHQIKGIYSLSQKKYLPLTHAFWVSQANQALDELPKGSPSWKGLQKTANKNKLLESYFENLASEKTMGAHLAIEFLQNLHHITNQLVDEGVASSAADVDEVLIHGFYHLYGSGHLPQKIKTLEVRA